MTAGMECSRARKVEGSFQVRPGGRCTVLELLEGGDEEIWYEIHLEFEKQNRVVQERELTEPQFGMATGQK